MEDEEYDYESNVFAVLTKNVPKEVFKEKERQFITLIEQINQNPKMLDLKDYFDEAPKELP